MSFLKQVRSAIYDPVFYKEQTERPIKQAWKYFFKLAVVVSLLTTIIISIRFLPVASALFSDETMNALLDYYPAELRLTLKDGQASSNMPEPYIVPLPTDWREVTINERSNLDNLVVIDTKTPFDIEKFAQYKTVMLITKNYIVYEKNHALTIQRLQSLPDGVIDRAQIAEWAQKIRPYLKFILPIGALGILCASFMAWIFSKLLYILVLSILVWLVEKLRKIEISYKQVFKLGLYAITAPAIIALLLSIFDLQTGIWIYALIYLIFAFANMRTIVSAKQIQP